jgi:hypothetical protein
MNAERALPVADNKVIDEALAEYRQNTLEYTMQILCRLHGSGIFTESNAECTENRFVASFLRNLAVVSSDQLSVASCGALVYRILEKTVHIPKIMEETYLEVAGIKKGEEEIDLERITRIAQNITLYDVGIAKIVLGTSLISRDKRYTEVAGFLTYAVIEQAVKKEAEKIRKAMFRDRKGMLITELTAKLRRAIATEHYEMAAQIRDELKLIRALG